MIRMTHTIAGDECEINYPERRADLAGFDAFMRQGHRILGLDTETAGLETYGDSRSPEGTFTRLVQFGSDREAWVLRADLFADAIIRALRSGIPFTIHNAPFDLKVLDRHLGVTIEELGPRVHDTRILAHLLDPRMESEGGAGLSLKPLSAIYVDDTAPDTQEGLAGIFSRLFAEWRKTVPEAEVEAYKKRAGKRPHMRYGFTNVPISDETFVRYAGLDVILGVRLFREIGALVRDLDLGALSKFEHHLSLLLTMMERRGVLVDVEYTEKLRPELHDEAERFAKVAARYGVANPNSTGQIAEALLGMGETLTETTDSKAWKVDKGVLLPLADLDQDWARVEAREPNPLADAILRTKRATKWETSYVDAFLNLRDSSDRIHPNIGGLQARTARMSVSNPPLQQLPSGDWKIRRALIADPGQTIVAADYAQVEMRVLAALCQDETLIEAILSGEDLHGFTARRVFGEDFTKRQRKISKGIGFGKVYGGGAVTVARQSGAPLDEVKVAMAAYDREFPGIKRYGRRLQERAQYGKREVVTVSGRHLPLDRDRLYAATNYVVQSTARDLLAQAIVDLHDAGLGDHLLLPVHDEVIAQAPTAEAADVVAEIGRVMESTFYGIPIKSEAEVYGPSWGHGYGAPA